MTLATIHSKNMLLMKNPFYRIPEDVNWPDVDGVVLVFFANVY